jgi:hypothetical protein
MGRNILNLTRSPAFHLIYCLALTFVLLLPVVTQATSFSPALKKLHSEIKRTIPHDSARDIESTRTEYPATYAVFVGLAMQKQKSLIKNSGDQAAFDSLDYEIRTGLQVLAQGNNNKSPASGKPLTADMMIKDYNSAVTGYWNDVMGKNGIDMNNVRMASVLTPTATITGSTALAKLHQQMIDTIPIQWGRGMEWTRQNFPITYALMLGFALQRQKILAQGNPEIQSYIQEWTYELENELKDLARKLEYIKPNDGTPMPAVDLLTAFRDSVKGGGINQWARQSLHFDPATTSAAPLTEQDFKALARFGQVENEPESQNNITLLGEEIAATEKPVLHTDVGGADIASYNRKGLVCPEHCPPYKSGSYEWLSRTAFRMGENNTTQCSYYDDGRINSQSTHGGKQGTNFWFSIKNGIYYLYSRTELYKPFEPRESGIRNGWEELAAFTPQKKPYLYNRKQYRNGIKHGLDHFYRVLPSGKPYLSSTSTYSNGKLHGTYTVFSFLPNSEKIYISTKMIYRNGKKIKETHYNPDKTPKREILYKSDGHTVDKEINFQQ